MVVLQTLAQQTMGAVHRYVPTLQEASYAHVLLGMHWALTAKCAIVSENKYIGMYTGSHSIHVTVNVNCH